MRKNILILSLIVLSSGFSTAQEAVTLETITVKGTKEQKSYFENTESVLILNENEISSSGSANSLQVLNAVPNVEVNKNGESISIRGINSTGVTGYQKDNLSSLIIDDIFQTELAIQAGSFDLWDLDRIEVLRGAQSTNQGVNSLAGSILMDHKKATMSDEGASKFGVGSFGHKEFGVMTNNVLQNSKTAIRLSYSKELNDGYIENKATDNSKWGQWNRDRFNLNLIYKPSEIETFSVVGKLNRNDQGGTYVQGTEAFDYEVNEDKDYNVVTENLQAGFQYERKISEKMNLKSVLAFSVSDQNSETDSDGTSQNTAGTRFETHKDHYSSFEIQLNHKSEAIQNLIGFHAHDFELKDDYDFNLLFPLVYPTSTPVTVLQTVDRNRRAYAIFDSLTYRLNESHSLVAGVRAEYVESKYGTGISGQRLQDLGPLNPNVDSYISGISGNYDGKKSSLVVLPKLGYLINSGTSYYGLTYTRAYRTAGVSINRRRATAIEYNPEYTNNFEASYKYAGQVFQLSSNLFYIDWHDQQVQVQLSNDFYDSQVQNAAKSEVYGAELEGKFKLNPVHTLSLGVGYAKTKFKNFETRSGNYAGKKFPFSSDITARTSYDVKLTDDLNILTVLRYVGEAYTNAENTRKADAQTYVDISARYLLNASWIFEGYVNNIADGQYRIFDGTPTSSTSPYQASYHQVNTPREIGVRANYYW